jgi:hypothetical protein
VYMCVFACVHVRGGDVAGVQKPNQESQSNFLFNEENLQYKVTMLKSRAHQF